MECDSSNRFTTRENTMNKRAALLEEYEILCLSIINRKPTTEELVNKLNRINTNYKHTENTTDCFGEHL
jgi:hypothetical protein